MSSRHFLILCVALLVSSVAAGGRMGSLLSNWKPIKDLKDKHVIEIAEFAVKEHNDESKTGLEYESVIKGEEQLVSGTNFRLVITAKDGGASNNYEAVVWEKLGAGGMSLTSFKRLLKA